MFWCLVFNVEMFSTCGVASSPQFLLPSAHILAFILCAVLLPLGVTLLLVWTHLLISNGSTSPAGLSTFRNKCVYRQLWTPRTCSRLVCTTFWRPFGWHIWLLAHMCSIACCNSGCNDQSTNRLVYQQKNNRQIFLIFFFLKNDGKMLFLASQI